MTQVKSGDFVRFNFIGRLEDGTVFDSSEEHHHHDDDCGCEGGGGPLEFRVGQEDVLPALEQAVIGMEVGDKRTVTLTPAEAYGEREDENIITVPRSEFPDDLEPEEDQLLEMLDDDGEAFPVWVTEVTDDTVTLDANHPLAGETLIFEMELTEIVATN